MSEEYYLARLQDMAKTGLHCPRCGLWFPEAELKTGLNCPMNGFEIGLYCPTCGAFCPILERLKNG